MRYTLLMDIESWKAQLRKGSAELAVLAVLAGGEKYGIEILDRISGVEGLGISEGSIYPLLNRLQREGRIEARWVENPEGGVPRKYYRLTANGEAAREAMVETWTAFRASLDRIVETRS
ncbi:PadR family transcriptional regulator [Marinicauda algicola]|nr:PadR family transcriptional regulator [Marinicauda algicola]